MSGLLYVAGFQAGGTNAMSCTVQGGAATIQDGYYMGGRGIDTSSVITPWGDAWPGQAYEDFGLAVKNAFDSATGTTFTVSLSSTTGLFTISRSTNFTITFAGSGSDPLALALGFNGNKSGASSYTSDKLPRYVRLSTIGGRSNVEGPYEPDDIAEMSVSDGGDDFVVTRKTNEYLMSWVQQMEPKSAIYDSCTSHAYTAWDRWFYDIRGTHPFYVNDTLEDAPLGAYYRLTGKGASFRPRRVTADYDDLWIVPFEAHWLGLVV